MDQKCYQGEGWHGLKLYQGIVIRMDPLSYNAHHISIMSELYIPPTYMNAALHRHLGDLQNEDEDRECIL